MMFEALHLQSCPKGYARDLDKAISPEETIRSVREKLGALPEDILAGTQRVDTGRLGIPVYLGICGAYARKVLPGRKQMGKGSSPAQAEASAIMELMERFAFFTFKSDPPNVTEATWSEAEKLFGQNLIPVEQILHSVKDALDPALAKELLNLRKWKFYPATNLATGRITYVPLDWFWLLGEFNGSSAGNTPEESLLQGVAELIERHVCNVIDEKRPPLHTIDQTSIDDPVLKDLCDAFAKNGITLVLKDFSLSMPMPTVGAIAWDPSTFPRSSEIVFTAGTASSPEKAAIRAITEVAQLGGDFCTNSCYEASGLPKFSDLKECEWLLEGPTVPLNTLPDISTIDIYAELMAVAARLGNVYAVDTTHPSLGIPAHYCMVPGLEFRERDKNQSLGLFLGRLLTEQEDITHAEHGLHHLSLAYPDAHFIPFFHAMLALRNEDYIGAGKLFSRAAPLQPDNEARALAAFYAGYAFTQAKQWALAESLLRQALTLSPGMKESANLLGVVYFKLQNYEQAEQCFEKALAVDRGSATDLANRGIARKFLGKTEAARHDLQIALELDPSLEFARKHLEEL